jgi:alkanesulfonate monooxygenase SsuD/methylene tetrahydromethanopterin reductase-like flavin-dependent oxidoreductase (luciferase family)
MMAHTRSRIVVGSPEQVRDELLALGEAYGVDEFVILTITEDYDSRLRSYELLAEACGLPARGA